APGRWRRKRPISNVAVSGPCTTIAFNLLTIATVIMDAMSVEDERRIAEEQHGIGADYAAEVGFFAGWLRGWWCLAGLLRLTIDDAVHLLDRYLGAWGGKG